VETKRSFEDLRVGDEMTPLVKHVTQDHINTFQHFMGHHERGEMSWLVGHNLHIDEEYSRRHMYGGNVGDGHQTISYLVQLLTSWLPAGALMRGNSSMDIKLTNPTRPGDTITVTGRVADKLVEDGKKFIVCEVRADNQNGKLVAIGTVKAYVK